MIIRPATADDAPQIARLINMAMMEITHQFIGKADDEEANKFMTALVRKKANQYSYQNIFVVQELDQILGQICIYDGAHCQEYREVVWQEIEKYTLSLPSSPIKAVERDLANFAEQETKAGEMYIDTLAVSPAARGKGIGKILLAFAIENFVHKQQKVLGLLVDKDNPDAKRLYEKIGFSVIEVRNIFGKTMEHMQYK